MSQGWAAKWWRLVGPAVLAAAAAASWSIPVAAKGAIDVRGTWAVVSVAHGTRYPSTLTITTENLNTGAFAGSQSGPQGDRYSVVGSVSGSSATFTSRGGTYTATFTGTVGGSGSSLSMTGGFTDSNGVTDGTATVRLTSGVAPSPGPPVLLLIGGAVVLVAAATAAAMAAGIIPTPGSADSGGSAQGDGGGSAAAGLSGTGEFVAPAGAGGGLPPGISFDGATQTYQMQTPGGTTDLGTHADMQNQLAQNGHPPVGSDLYNQTIQQTTQAWAQQAGLGGVAPTSLPPHVSFDPTTQMYQVQTPGGTTDIGSHADMLHQLGQQGNPPVGSDLYNQTVQQTTQGWAQQAGVTPSVEP